MISEPFVSETNEDENYFGLFTILILSTSISDPDENIVQSLETPSRITRSM